jgi:hypothetical protein
MAPSNSGKRYTVFSIKSAKGGSAVWVRAGSAWVNRDGSMNVYLDVLPLDGKLHLREASRDGEMPSKVDESPESSSPVTEVNGDGR